MNGSIVLKSSWISIELMIIYLPKNKKYIKSTFIWKKGKKLDFTKKTFYPLQPRNLWLQVLNDYMFDF